MRLQSNIIKQMQKSRRDHFSVDVAYYCFVTGVWHRPDVFLCRLLLGYCYTSLHGSHILDGLTLYPITWIQVQMKGFYASAEIAVSLFSALPQN